MITSDIGWFFDTCESIINSIYNITLQPLEELLVYLHYNYTSTGNFTVNATAYTDEFTETKIMEVEVI